MLIFSVQVHCGQFCGEVQEGEPPPQVPQSPEEVLRMQGLQMSHGRILKVPQDGLQVERISLHFEHFSICIKIFLVVEVLVSKYQITYSYVLQLCKVFKPFSL